jgi:6-phosphogluconolactonase (cycloisomerase 2 family)
MIERMSKRLWLLGVVGLVLIGLLLACGNQYNPSQDGLLLVSSQGAGLIQTYAFTLSNGHTTPIANSPNDTANAVCVLHGLPASMVADPKGQYAYTIINESPTECGQSTVGGIAVFKIASDGGVSQVGSLIPDKTAVALTMDPTGKFLFAAEGTAGLVNVYAIGSGGALTAVPGNYNFNNGTAFRVPNIVAVAPTPTVFPGIGINGTVNSICQIPGNQPPTAEFLYAVDSNNYGVWEFSVDTSTGALGNPPGQSQVAFFASDQIPMGVAVDPCTRFVYVSDSQTNKISAYFLCIRVQAPTPCPNADGSLAPIAGSPFAMSGSANAPGPLLVDPFGNNLFVLGTLSNTISAFKISQISGAITALSPATVATGLQPTSMVIRADGNWMFVANYNAATVSQYSMSPVTGTLTVEPPILTDNYPFGVAVK